MAGVQLGRLLLGSPRLARAPRGDGGPVVDIPGWRAPESSMAPLRAYLRRLGHDARTWGFGTNLGNPQRDAERMARSVADLSAETGRRVGLVGWSLGGVIAREVAREVPEHVSCVITYGTPIVGGPMHTVAAGSYEPGFGDQVDGILDELNASRPIRVPILSIFSRRDGIVSWPACIDRASPNVRHVEVNSTHLGLGIDPDVWLLVARELARFMPDVENR
jgi:pimeloyl-ACP methyl ester carboxylesterase